MEYTLSAVLTIILSFCIIYILKKRNTDKYSKVFYRQSDMHIVLQGFLFKDTAKPKKVSQLSKRTEENTIKIIAVENKAYWVDNNVFYVAEWSGNSPDLSTAKPVDTTNMNKEDIDKMLFILDNLGGGNNERGGTRN